MASNAHEMPTDGCLAQLAAIFAAGFLRLRSRPGYVPIAHGSAADSSKKLSESPGASAPPSAPCAHRLTPRENESAGEET